MTAAAQSPLHNSVDPETFRKNQASTTMGDPDGPIAYVASLDEEVPTFIDPRKDLIVDGKNLIRLNYHVPFKKRGIYKAEWLPEEHVEDLSSTRRLRIDDEGYVLCNGRAKYRDNAPCEARAKNRSGFCAKHGGMLHPADKKLSAQNVAPIPQDRVERLDRVQKFMQGFLSFDELTDDEVVGAFIYNDQGIKIASTKLGDAIHQGITKELFKRMNRFMQMKLPNMLKVISEIAESPVVEPADRHKAAVWLAERVMGKNPDVVLFGKAEARYETILEQVESGSREAFRNGRTLPGGSNDGQLAIIEGTIVEDDDDDDEDSEWIEESRHNGSSGDSSGDGNGIPLSNVNDTRISGDNEGQSGSSLADATKRIDNAKAARDRIKKAKRSRFAARATGAGDLESIPWIFLRRPLENGSGWKLKCYPPEKQTENVLAEWNVQQMVGERGLLEELARVAEAHARSLAAKISS